jgi:hypothetical protein
MWKALGDSESDQNLKRELEAKHETDKIRFKDEMEAYEKDCLEHPENHMPKSKTEKDKDAPKKPLSAYAIFAKQRRDEIKKERHPKKKGDKSKEKIDKDELKEITELVKKEWKVIEEKKGKRYKTALQLEADAKQKYEEEMLEYKRKKASGGGKKKKLNFSSSASLSGDNSGDGIEAS